MARDFTARFARIFNTYENCCIDKRVSPQSMLKQQDVTVTV